MGSADELFFSDSRQWLPRVFGHRTALDMMGAIWAALIECYLRFRLGYQNRSTSHTPYPRRSSPPGIPPSTLPVRPIWFPARGQRRFLRPKWFRVPVASFRLLSPGAVEQIVQPRKRQRRRIGPNHVLFPSLRHYHRQLIVRGDRHRQRFPRRKHLRLHWKTHHHRS